MTGESKFRGVIGDCDNVTDRAKAAGLRNDQLGTRMLWSCIRWALEQVSARVSG